MIEMPTDVQFKDELSATSMIFKTFDSDIDNMSSRWGMFWKSFSDIGDTITTKWKQVTD